MSTKGCGGGVLVARAPRGGPKRRHEEGVVARGSARASAPGGDDAAEGARRMGGLRGVEGRGRGAGAPSRGAAGPARRRGGRRRGTGRAGVSTFFFSRRSCDQEEVVKLLLSCMPNAKATIF